MSEIFEEPVGSHLLGSGLLLLPGGEFGGLVCLVNDTCSGLGGLDQHLVTFGLLLLWCGRLYVDEKFVEKAL